MSMFNLDDYESTAEQNELENDELTESTNCICGDDNSILDIVEIKL